MGAVSNIVLPDAQATPVNHTFIPLGQDAQGAWWFEDQATDSPIGFQRISISLKRPAPSVGKKTNPDQMNRVRVTLNMPRLETLGTGGNGFVPPPTVAYVARASMEFMIPDRATLQDRKDARKYILGVLANAQLVAAVENLQNIY